MFYQVTGLCGRYGQRLVDDHGEATVRALCKSWRRRHDDEVQPVAYRPEPGHVVHCICLWVQQGELPLPLLNGGDDGGQLEPLICVQESA